MKSNNVKSYIYSIIVVLAFILVAVGASLAALIYADVVGNKKNGSVEIRTAYVTAVFHNLREINDKDVKPGYENYMEFEIINTSNTENAIGRYKLMWEIEKNEISDENFVYSLESISTKNGVEINSSNYNRSINVSETPIPDTTFSLGSGVINTGITHRYKLTIKFKDNNKNQDYLSGKTFIGKIVAVGE